MKKWLFCDIEASNGTDICSFGYVLTDEWLQILDKKDILIKPSKPFIKVVEGLLAYPKEIFMVAPTFVEQKDTIFQLLYTADVVIGHAFSNDIKFLNIACLENNIKMPPLQYFDTQILYNIVNSSIDNRRVGLERIVEKLGLTIDDSLHLHRADDDAYLTMLVLQKFCQQQQVTPSELLQNNITAFGKFENGINYEYTTDKVRLFKNNIKRYVANQESKPIKELLGKRFAICNEYQNAYPLKIWTLVTKMIDVGGILDSNSDLLDIYIWNKDSKDRIYKRQKELNKKCNYMSLEQICSLLGQQWDTLPEYLTDNYCAVGKHDLNSDRAIKEFGLDKPSNNPFATLLAKLNQK